MANELYIQFRFVVGWSPIIGSKWPALIFTMFHSPVRLQPHESENQSNKRFERGLTRRTRAPAIIEYGADYVINHVEKQRAIKTVVNHETTVQWMCRIFVNTNIFTIFFLFFFLHVSAWIGSGRPIYIDNSMPRYAFVCARSTIQFRMLRWIHACSILCETCIHIQ